MPGSSHADAPTGDSPTSRSHPGRRARSRPEQLRLLLAGLLGGLAIAFALLNLKRVSVDWILGTWETPLIVVILVSLLVGAILGFLLARRRLAGAAKTHSTATHT
ncbi:MAG TPA: LapA family protein [Solirubrobacteraceae bacterium]|jgi:uncharacterized integral membrane protein